MGLSELRQMRTEYAEQGLDEASIGSDPLGLFATWMDEAVMAGVPEPNAMALSTADAEATPSVRIVLLKSIDEFGAVFYTNYESTKGAALAQNPQAEAVMLWHEIGRQVRFFGRVTKTSAAESDAYFALRPEGARLGAIASPQSRPVQGRAELDQRWSLARELDELQRPDHWGGYRIEVSRWEFWQGRANRFHDRFVFSHHGDQWQRERLAP